VNLFNWLLIGHLIGDFLVQSESMATHKETSWSWMLKHVGIYMVVISLVLVAYGVAHHLPLSLVLIALLVICVTHIVLDRRDFTAWWIRRLGLSAGHTWLPIMVDQVFHLLTLAAVAQVVVWAGN
jgi:hypothetical protein